MSTDRKRRDYSKIGLSREETETLLDSQLWCYVASKDDTGNLWNLPEPFVRKAENIYFLDSEDSIMIKNLRYHEHVCVVVDAGYSYDELAGVIIQGRLKTIDNEEQLLATYDLLTRKYPQAIKAGLNPERFKLIEFTPRHEINRISWHFGKAKL